MSIYVYNIKKNKTLYLSIYSVNNIIYFISNTIIFNIILYIIDIIDID